jgi:hypothetical protein
LVWFGFFGFLLIKPKPNRTGWFFQKYNRFNRFFFSVRFFQLFFSGFLGLIGFPVFFLTATIYSRTLGGENFFSPVHKFIYKLMISILG